VGRAPVIRKVVGWADARSGTAPFLKKTLRYVFPDHWSFMLGEVALYAFLVLLGTGIYLTLFFEPSIADVTYGGSYEPLRGREMSEAYQSVLDLSFEVKAGLLMRQTHHWAANVFVAAIVLHLLRVFFTGAYRKPRQVTYYLGLGMLMLAVLEGFLGYSLVDDLLSGMGLQIAYSVVASIPVVGGNLALWLWGDEFPGSSELQARLYIGHVLLLPVAIGTMLALHLALVALNHHTQFRGPRRREDNVVGTPLWPGYALRSSALLFATAAVLFALGGLVQINPIWLWGPFETWLSTNGAQPDWYLGWLIGGLRIMPAWEPAIGDYTLVPNAFWGGALFPLVVFAFLFLWPTIERRATGDDAFHQLLDRPRDAPGRTAVGVGFFTWVWLVFMAGSADRVFVELGIPYRWQIWIYRVVVLLLPPLAAWVTLRATRELRRTELHPLRRSYPAIRSGTE
jgi:ubiquinol-cytochrome c reductase cytochrome b subunit